MTQLHHLFVQGLRFDTEPQYLTSGAQGKRYSNLPLKPPLKLPPGDGGVLGVIQCAAIVAQLSLRHIPTLTYQVQCHVEDVIGMFQICLTGSLCEAIDLPNREILDDGLLHVLHRGGIAMIRYQVGSEMRWSVVVGVELDGSSMADVSRLRALLLLDSLGGEPWACGHNVRMELQTTKGGTDGLLYRHLTGEMRRVHLQCLVRILPVGAT